MLYFESHLLCQLRKDEHFWKVNSCSSYYKSEQYCSDYHKPTTIANVLNKQWEFFARGVLWEAQNAESQIIFLVYLQLKIVTINTNKKFNMNTHDLHLWMDTASFPVNLLILWKLPTSHCEVQ